MIRVLIADDHAIVRDGLSRLLQTADDVELVGTAVDGEAAVQQARELHPDVVLMDLSMHVLDGVAATRRLAAEVPDAHVLVLTSFGDTPRILDSLSAGAEGYLLKSAEPEEILNGIRQVVSGGSPLDPKAARALVNSRRSAASASLTDREREVLGCVVQGLANKQIARRLGISERTVKAHLTSTFQRIGVTDRTQAALWAERHLGSARD